MEISTAHQTLQILFWPVTRKRLPTPMLYMLQTTVIHTSHCKKTIQNISYNILIALLDNTRNCTYKFIWIRVDVKSISWTHMIRLNNCKTYGYNVSFDLQKHSPLFDCFIQKIACHVITVNAYKILQENVWNVDRNQQLLVILIMNFK